MHFFSWCRRHRILAVQRFDSGRWDYNLDGSRLVGRLNALPAKSIRNYSSSRIRQQRGSWGFRGLTLSGGKRFVHPVRARGDLRSCEWPGQETSGDRATTCDSKEDLNSLSLDGRGQGEGENPRPYTGSILLSGHNHLLQREARSPDRGHRQISYFFRPFSSSVSTSTALAS